MCKKGKDGKVKRDRCLRIADRKFDKPSAYKSGAVVRFTSSEDSFEKIIAFLIAQFSYFNLFLAPDPLSPLAIIFRITPRMFLLLWLFYSWRFVLVVVVLLKELEVGSE